MFLSDLIPHCDKAVAATPITGVTCDLPRGAGGGSVCRYPRHPC